MFVLCKLCLNLRKLLIKHHIRSIRYKDFIEGRFSWGIDNENHVIYGELWEIMGNYGELWKNYGETWEIYGELWGIYGEACKIYGIYGRRRKTVTSYMRKS